MNFIDPYGLWHDAKTGRIGVYGDVPQTVELPEAVGDVGKMMIDAAVQKAAVDTAKKYIGTAAGAVLKKAFFWLGIFDPFPPPAGDPSDMLVIPRENDSPCN